MTTLSLPSKLALLKGVWRQNSPFYVQYYIIAQCNLSCRMCNIVEANSDLVPVPLERVEKIARNLRKVGAGIVLLTGGEPFMHQRLPDIVRIFVKAGLSPRLQTAGLASREQLQACYDAGARDINISLDSLIEEKQDYINGSHPGSWRRALRAMADVNAVFRDPARTCALGCVISRHNFREIPYVLEFATRAGFWLSLVPAHITDPTVARNFRGTDDMFRFRPEDMPELDALLEKLLSMKKTHLLFDSEPFLRSAFHFLKTGEVTWRQKDGNVCDSPNLYFAVLPNGDFAVCCDHRYDGKLNVANDDFPEVYRSKPFRDNVYRTTSGCDGCNYGSYPEVTLIARDRKVFFERVLHAFRSRRRPVPTYTFEELLAIAKELANESARVASGVPEFTPKPAALSQRYGQTKLLNRQTAREEWSQRVDALRAAIRGKK